MNLAEFQDCSIKRYSSTILSNIIHSNALINVVKK